MTRTIWAGAFAALIAIAISAPLVAQPPQGMAGRGPGRGGFGGPMGRGGPGMGLPFLRELNLTDAQREQVRALTEERRGQVPPATGADLQRQLGLAIFADTPEPQKIEDLKNAIAAAHAEELAARIQLEARVAQILTPEQRAQARSRLENGGPPRGRGR
jgi:Spy/CpxP family protein refolding chaperone